MELKRATSRRNIRSFSTYDMEWIPGTLEIRLVGTFDGERYRSFRTVEDFLDAVLVSSNRGRWFFAHAGGLADIQFIFDVIARDDRYTVNAAFSGSSAIIVHIRRGNNVWHFIDSLWLFRSSLAQIGKSIGLHKTGPTDEMNDDERKEWYATVDIDILDEYCRNDCVVLFRAIEEFQYVVLELGGQLQMTIASTAMQLFKRRYLAEPIFTSELINQRAIDSYTASRVEVFAADCDDSFYYDINSSFPHAMTESVPGSLIDCRSKLSETILDSDIPILAWCKVRVRDCYMPPLPYRVAGRVFFPVGTWDSWFTGIDLALLLREGGEILQCREVLVFEPRYDLREYALDLYAKRNQTTDEFLRYTFKIFLNSLYGKFAESRVKEQLHINPSRETLARIKAMADDLGLDARREFMKRPGVWIEPIIRSIPHRHVAVSSYITARARQTIFDYMGTTSEVHYCDTDGFSTPDLLETGSHLGALKLEKHITHAEFIAPKVYMIDGTVEGKAKTLVKAKGFSLAKQDDPLALFHLLRDGREIEITRMRRIKENLRDGTLMPRESLIRKAVRFTAVPKRYMYPDGETRPWSVKEIRGL